MPQYRKPQVRTVVNTKAVARRRVLKAMDLVESAQHTLERAAQELSPIVGMQPRWAAVGKVAERAHAEWYRLKGAADRGRFDMDGMTADCRVEAR
jgi:hypothetical protein